MSRTWSEVRAEANLDQDRVAAHRARLDEEVRAYQEEAPDGALTTPQVEGLPAVQAPQEPRPR